MPDDITKRLHDAANEVDDRLAKAAAEGQCEHSWTGEGQQPAKFWCVCGTLVYRSLKDFYGD